MRILVRMQQLCDTAVVFLHVFDGFTLHAADKDLLRRQQELVSQEHLVEVHCFRLLRVAQLIEALVLLGRARKIFLSELPRLKIDRLLLPLQLFESLAGGRFERFAPQALIFHHALLALLEELTLPISLLSHLALLQFGSCLAFVIALHLFAVGTSIVVDLVLLLELVLAHARDVEQMVRIRLALVHDVLGEEAADQVQRLRVVSRQTVVEVLNTSQTPACVGHGQLDRFLGAAWHSICLLARLKQSLQTQPIALVGRLDLVEAHTADALGRQKEVVLILTQESDRKLTLAN